MVQVLAKNNAYLTIDGYDMAAIGIEVTAEMAGTSNEQPYGFGSNWTKREPGLKDLTLNVNVIYDTDNIDSYITSIATQQKVTVVYGPEGNTTGKPKHSGSFIVDSLTGPTVVVTKDQVIFEMSLVTADEPTDDMYAGAKF